MKEKKRKSRMFLVDQVRSTSPVECISFWLFRSYIFHIFGSHILTALLYFSFFHCGNKCSCPLPLGLCASVFVCVCVCTARVTASCSYWQYFKCSIGLYVSLTLLLSLLSTLCPTLFVVFSCTRLLLLQATQTSAINHNKKQ